MSYVANESDDVFVYALNITGTSTYNGATRGTGLAIICQSSTLCDYLNGATTSGFGSIGDFRYNDGRLALSVSLLDGELFFSADDTDQTASTDSQGRQVIEGLGYWLNSSGNLLSGYVSATRVGDARTLQSALPTTPDPPIEPPTEPTPPIDPEPPVIGSFSASPQTVTVGDDVSLSWNVEGADTLRISPEVGTVTGSSVVIEPNETTTYTLTAVNDGGSDTASVRVAVQTPAPPEAALRYWVNTTCGKGVSTTYATVDGGTAQRDFKNGYVYTVDSGVQSDTFLYISAQNQCDSGDVTVRIYKRGSIYKETTSSGAYVIATASGSY